ncbi:hypothetical protein Arno162_99 [Pectobacterium phage Arno162]|uniref:Tail fiber protein n=1 Tax=Pectobacterium phage Arno162 TaxID=2500577 RepID=A0A678ZMB5_9CAUD|nr:hypothetical protein Arno162_99 [Pectobacterium phage Arno162]
MADLKINNLDAIAPPLQDDDLLLVKMKRRANALGDEDRQASWAVVRNSLNLGQYMPTVGGTFTGTVTLANNIGLNSRATNGTARRLLQFGSNNRLAIGEIAAGMDIYAGDFPRFTKDGTNFYNVITTNNLPTPASLSDGGAYTKAQVDAIALTKANLSGAQFTGHVIINPDIPLRSFNTQGGSVNMITYQTNGVNVGDASTQMYLASGVVPLWYNGSTNFKIYSEGSKPTAAELGFYSTAQLDAKFDQKANLSGAQFTGQVGLNNNVALKAANSSGIMWNLLVRLPDNSTIVSDWANITKIASSQVPVWKTDSAGTTEWKFYTEGNKPTVAELGLTDTVNKASTALQQGSYGLGGVPQFLSDAGFLAVSNQTQFFSQTGASDQQRFGGRGNGVHIFYGLTPDQTQSLSSSLFVRDNAKVIAKWSTANASNGAPIQTLTNELYGTLNKPTAADVGAYSKAEADQTFAKQSGTGNPIPAGTSLATYDALKAGVWYQDVPANATLALGYPVANVAGVLDVSPIQGNGSCYQEYKTLNSTVRWVRYINTSETSPWRAISTDTDTRTSPIKIRSNWEGISIQPADANAGSYLVGLNENGTTAGKSGAFFVGRGDATRNVQLTSYGVGNLTFIQAGAVSLASDIGHQILMGLNGSITYTAAAGGAHEFTSIVAIRSNGEGLTVRPYSDDQPSFITGSTASGAASTWRIGKFSTGADINFSSSVGQSIGYSTNGNTYHDAPNHIHIFNQQISSPSVDTNLLSAHKANGGEVLTLKSDGGVDGAWMQVRDISGAAACSLGMRPNENTAEFFNSKANSHLRLMADGSLNAGSQGVENLDVQPNGDVYARSRIFTGSGSGSLGTDGNVGGAVWGTSGTAKAYIDSVGTTSLNSSKTYTDQKLAAQNSKPMRKIWGKETGSYPSYFDSGFLPLPPDASHAVAANTTFGAGRSIRLDEPLWGKKLWSMHGDSYSSSVSDPRGFARAWTCRIPNMSGVTSIDDQGNVRPFIDFEIGIGSGAWRFRMSTDGRTITHIDSSGGTTPIYSLYVQDNV